MSFLSDPYALYVIAAYGATAAILVWLVVATVLASRRARRALDEVERRRR